tara:strand:- start:3162 stop:4130 length:969 start_codon:yes stop_codon:yes gene_type:complete
VKLILYIVSLFCPAILAGQNLVINGSFEDTSRHSNGILRANDWLDVTSSSPDFFHPNRGIPYSTAPSNFAGFQLAKNGIGYFGLILYSPYNSNGREYIQGKLSVPLHQDSNYCFQLYISLGDSSHYAIKRNLGVYFSNQRVDSLQVQHRLLHLNPQITFDTTTFFIDKQNWVLLSGGFKAQGGERFFVIGNYDADSLLDTLRMAGGGSQIYHQNTYYYFDDVSLVPCDSFPGMITSVSEETVKERFGVYPNPSNGQVHLELPKAGKQAYHFQLYDLNGRLVFEASVKQSRQLQLGDLPSGMYHYRLMSNGVPQKIGKVIIQK